VKVIHKYELPIGDEVIVEMPADSEVLHVCSQFGDARTVTMWVRCDLASQVVRRRFLIRGTGHEVGDEPHIGTVIAAGGQIVWHVFDGGFG
jgi:hypothetical protein